MKDNDDSVRKRVDSTGPEAFAGPEEGAAAPDSTGSGHDQETVALAKSEHLELVKRAEERDLYRNELLRAKADLDNYQKRVRKERPQWEEQAVRRFIRDLLPVFDNFERALSHAETEGGASKGFEEGVRLTHQMMLRLLADHGVEEIDAEGRPFNPEWHEAVSQVEGSKRPAGHVDEVFEKGYRHKEAVLRPSKVSVSRGQGGPSPGGEPGSGEEDAV